MQVTTYSDPKAFLLRAAPYLESDPFSPSVIATVTARIASGMVPSGEDHVWLTVEDDEARVIGLSMHTPPYNMFLSGMAEEAARFLAREVALSGRILPGVNGAIVATRAFARAWAQSTGHTSTVLRETRMYRLVELLPPRAVPGDAHLAESPRDLSLVADWLAAFHDEAQPHAPVDDWTAMAQRRIGAEDLRLWQTRGAPVALAGVSKAVAGVARVGPVYTPPRWRGNGYGSGVTAAATSAALRAGAQHVVLYTDLANPTSNSIYQKIGYGPDHDAEERTFDS